MTFIHTEPDETAAAIRDYLWNNDDLLKSDYKSYLQHPLAGYCYIASECWYHLQDSQEAWTPHWLSVEWEMENLTASMTHWYLVHDESQKVVDLTAEQFDAAPVRPQYSGGTGSGFQTVEPSERAQTVIEEI